jgi:hypothetical protein
MNTSVVSNPSFYRHMQVFEWETSFKLLECVPAAWIFHFWDQQPIFQKIATNMGYFGMLDDIMKAAKLSKRS